MRCERVRGDRYGFAMLPGGCETSPVTMSSPSRASGSVISRLAAIDLRSLAAFRICLGALLFWDHLHGFKDAWLFYTDDGVLPRTLFLSVFAQGSQWSLHLLGGSVLIERVLLAAGMLAAGAVAAGWRTRMSLAVVWVLTISLHTRNPAILYGGDTALRMLAFWGLFLPLGARWSMDARRTSFGEPDPHVSMAALALMLQVAMIYWFTAILKYGVEWTRDGTAVYYVLMADQFVRTPGIWLLPHEDLCRWLTFGVWWLELLGPFFAFIPWRTTWFRIGVMMSMWLLHLGLALCLRIGCFPYIMMTCWLPFVPAVVWDWLGWGRKAQPDGDPDASMAGRGERPFRHAAQHAVVFAALGIVLIWNLWTVAPDRWSSWLPRPVRAVVDVLRIDQNWALFAPTPITDDGWMILDAELYDGTHIDLLRDGQPASYAKPRSIHSEYPDWKWHKLQVNLVSDGFAALRKPFGDALARRWCLGDAHPKVRNWTLWFVREETLPHRLAYAPQKIELARNALFIAP